MRTKQNHSTLIPNRAWRILTVMVTIILASCTSGTETLQVETPEVTETVSPARLSTPTPTPDVTPTQETPVHLKVQADDLAGIVVRFVHPWMGPMAEALEAAATQFSLSNEWDIWVEVEAPGSDSALLESLQTDIDSGDVPGLIATYPYLLETLDGQLFSVNLTDYFYDPEWGVGAEALGDIPPVYLEQFTSGGHLVALPVAPQATVLFYNQTWGEEIGFASPPTDERDFRKQNCEAVFANNEDRDEDNDGMGGWVINFDPDVLASWYYSFGGELPITGVPEFNTEAGQTAFGYLKSVSDQGCFWIGRRPEPNFYFANRYALTFAGTLDQIPTQMSWMAEAENEDVWTVMGFPGMAGEIMLIDGPGLMLTADAPENQMAAWLFARYLLTPEVQADLVRSGFSLPVRQSSMALLVGFATDYPQWAQAASMIEDAHAVPISEGWGIGQWVLQDAFYRLLQSETDQLPMILQELDDMISELEGMGP
jgi:ABC-type glycerol-3-phosphate transport system substrate-binding protein